MDWNQNNESELQQQNIGYSGGGYSNHGSSVTDNGFSVASLITGFLSVITCYTGVTCIPLGALGILFALLSRNSGRRFPTMAVIGILISVLGLILGGILLYCSFKILLDPEFRISYIDPLYRELYGIDFEELLQRYYQIAP